MSTQDKRQSIKTEVLADGCILFSTPAGSFKFNPAGCTDEVERQACVKGYKEKISNVAAMPAGTAWTVKLAAMREVAERLQTGGVWNLKGTGKLALNRDALFEAIATAKGVSLDKVLAAWGNMDEEFLRVRLTDKDVAAEYARLTASGTGAEEELFAGLEG